MNHSKKSHDFIPQDGRYEMSVGGTGPFKHALVACETVPECDI